MESVSATKFRVSEKTPESYRNTTRKGGVSTGNENVVSQLSLYKTNYCTELLKGTKFPSTTRVSKTNGFVNTVVECYNYHYNLVIRPDDIWAAIITQFSFYINANSEKYRKQFVSFEGKKELVVEIEGTLRSAPYDLFVSLMTEKIDENLVDKEMKAWILPNFTTTRKDDLIAFGAVFMAAMKNYFDYTCVLRCGIPWITLEGTLEDWQSILQRLEKLKSYDGLTKWFDLLEPVVRQFVEAKKGNVDLDFWQKICHKTGGGSGPTYLCGWISVFCVFNEDGIWQTIDKMGKEGNYPKGSWPTVDLAKVPSGIVEVDVKIIDVDGTEYHSVLLAGHMAVDVLETKAEKCTLKPQIGWALVLKPSPEEMKAIKIKEEQERRKRYGF